MLSLSKYDQQLIIPSLKHIELNHTNIMEQEIKYVHTNLIAKDWRKLADFYIKVFDCKPTYPERDLHGEWLDKLTNINAVKIKGIHLLLPGYYTNGPTLEIFEYTEKESNPGPILINNFGFSHIAFRVENVEEAISKVIEHGGKKYGEFVKNDYHDIGTVSIIYIQDIEGNIIELQNWK